jgi:hypothetical protein
MRTCDVTNVSKRKKKIVKKLSKKLSKSCQNVVKKLSKSCQNVVKKLSKSFKKLSKIVVPRPSASASLTGRRKKRVARFVKS